MSLASVIRYVRAMDTSSTTGAGKTGLAHSDITAKYVVKGGTLTSLTTETITTLGTYQAPTSSAHIRIKELNSAAPTDGVYEVHFHDTTVAASGLELWLFLSATGALFAPFELDLVRYADQNSTYAANLASAASNYSATRGLSGTALPAAAAEAAGGLYTRGTGAGQINQNANGQVDVNTTHIAGTAWASTTLFTLASHDPGTTIGTSTLTQTQVTGGAYALNSASFAFNSGLDFTTTQKAATLARVTLVDTVTTYTGNTPQTGDSYAIVNSGTHGNAALKTLIDAVDNYVDTEVAAIKAVTDLLPDGGALTSLATQASVNAIDDYVDTEVAAIKAKTDQLTFSAANKVDCTVLRVGTTDLQPAGTGGQGYGA